MRVGLPSDAETDLRAPRILAGRLADAMRRGAMVTGSQDFLALDWFELADRPVPVVRLELGVTRKALPAGITAPGP